MHSSLAAYGLDPSSAVVEAPLADEDGGVEEDDESDDESDSDDDDDVKLVFTGQTGRALDLRYVNKFRINISKMRRRGRHEGAEGRLAHGCRKPQQAPTNVIGIGKWAHTSTGQAATPAVNVAKPISTPTKGILHL